MNSFQCAQYLIFSLCINVFSVFVYLAYRSDVLSVYFQPSIKSEYDFIIVGSGTAGSIIAHRLEADTNYTYLMLEAGSRSTALLEIPVLGPLLQGSLYDWQFQTTKQDNACLAMNGICRLPQGKIVGGSSKLNNMIHVRGNLNHYVNWFEGQYSKNYIKQQFEYVERNILYLDTIIHSTDLADAVLRAAQELNYKIDDINEEFGQKFMRTVVTQRDGKRFSPADYIASYEHVITNALVEKVLIDDKLNAQGVTFSRYGEKHNVYAKIGVIVSSGTLNSPKILQLSGVGPKKVLNDIGIPVIVDLPVGKNLQDHVTTGFDLITLNTTLNVRPTELLDPVNIFQYFFEGTGPFTSPGCEVLGFVSSNNTSNVDLQLMVLPLGLTTDLGARLRRSVGISNQVWEDYFAKSLSDVTATILPVVLHPKSRGEVYVTSKDPNEYPAINPRYLSHADDVMLLVKGLKLVKRFIETHSMQRLGASLNHRRFPQCKNHRMFSDGYLKCYVRHLTLTSFHPVGTCSMGQGRVVDTDFKVFGVNRLFVVDASVLPSLPSGNINAAVAMMANVFFEANFEELSET